MVLPLLRAGGSRCSVKPAWRGSLHSKSRETRAFAWVTRLNYPTWNWVSQHHNPMTRPQGLGQPVHTTLKPPLGLQAHVTELGDECSVAQLLCFHWSCSFLAMWDSSLLPFLLPKSMSLDPPQTKGRGISESGPPVKIWTVQNERPFLILSTPRFYGNRHRSHDKIEHLIYNLINGYIINCMFNLTLGLTPFKVKYDYISFNERVLFILNGTNFQ